MRVAVVGAGMAGLVTLHVIEKRLIDGKFNDLEVVAYERGDQVGGEWLVSDKAETFDQATPLSSSMYHGLQCNFPYPMMQLHPDFPWPPETNTYATQEEVLAYIQSIYRELKLAKFIQFSKSVSNIRRDAERLAFDVTDINSGSSSVEKFDFVFLCTGQHRIPFIPTDADTSKFLGLKLHYHDLKNPERLRGKRVLVVGSAFAAMDMATVLPAIGAEKIYFSWNRNKPFWYNDKFLKEFELKPKLLRAAGNTAVFADESSVEVDVILYTTGFRQYYPLSAELDLDFNASKHLFPIYKHVVHPACPKLFFIGESPMVMLFRLQAEFSCAVIEGKVDLPSEEEMLEDIKNFKAKWLPEIARTFDRDITKYSPLVEMQRELANHLGKLSKSEPIDGDLYNLCYATIYCWKNDVLRFRQYHLVDRRHEDVSSTGKYFHPPKDTS